MVDLPAPLPPPIQYTCESRAPSGGPAVSIPVELLKPSSVLVGVLEVSLDRAADALAVDQERVVAVRCVELDVGDGGAPLAQRVCELALLPDREQDVRGHADHERRAEDPLDRRPPARSIGEVEQVHRLRDVEVRVRVE